MKNPFDAIKESVVQLEKAIKKVDKNSDEVDKKLKTVIKSECLYKDVYKMRDDFEDIKKFMYGFKNKIKRAFDVKDI